MYSILENGDICYSVINYGALSSLAYERIHALKRMCDLSVRPNATRLFAPHFPQLSDALQHRYPRKSDFWNGGGRKEGF